MSEYSLLSDLLTVCFDGIAFIGGIHLIIGVERL